MFGLGLTEVLIFAAILILLFGAKRIPAFVRGIGESARHIKKSFSDGTKGKTDKSA